MQKKNQNQNDLSICLECEKNYYLESTGDCKKINAHCIEGYKQNYCKKCEDGYYLYKTESYNRRKNILIDVTKCIKNPNNCLKFEINKNCLECEIGYYPYFDQCKEGINHCVYGNSTKCNECESGYYYDDSECLKIPDKNCLIYLNDEGTLKCEKCFDKYYVDNGICKEFPDKNCKNNNVENGNFVCINCDDGYYLNNNKCYLIENCAEFEGTKCVKCKEGFALNEKENKCVNTCKSKEKICGRCQRFYGSFDYGQSCILLDNEKDGGDNKGKFIDINLILIYLILMLVY